jgi:hypothetical protein
MDGTSSEPPARAIIGFVDDRIAASSFHGLRDQPRTLLT